MNQSKLDVLKNTISNKNFKATRSILSISDSSLENVNLVWTLSYEIDDKTESLTFHYLQNYKINNPNDWNSNFIVDYFI